MAENLSVDVGDLFTNIETNILVEVVKIWFEYSVADRRWETYVAWERGHLHQKISRETGKGCDFVKMLNEGHFGLW